jgi:hypothetical protein
MDGKRYILTAAALIFLASSTPAADKPLDFAHDIVPILRKHCCECHTGEKKEGGFSLNTRPELLKGGESGAVVAAGKSAASELIRRVTSTDETERMPPKGDRVPAADVAQLTRWIDEGLAWEEGFSFRPSAYEPPLAPRRPELPPAQGGRENPLDRIVDAYLAEHGLPRPQSIDDGQFLRRASLDLTGLLPTPEKLQTFLADSRPDKRERLVRELLADDVAYAEHWLTFWNDLLRNDYTGTGFITGGRKQITKWLYEALVTNKPYDQFARELIAPPTPESEGYIQGIRWRGEVSEGQTVEIQFAQSIGQSFLGINLKCASCHDSFIDRWKLDEAYGLAAIYAQTPLQLHRCDKPTGKTAQAAWLFPELGQIDAAAPQPERLKQLAGLMTHEGNGRFTRTIVNRLWQRMLGRGIVHPVDAMQSEPFSADLLDYLSVHLSDNGYDLKKTLELIATSHIYQSRAQVLEDGVDDGGYAFAGPRAKRLTAEQFVDAVWQLTEAAPATFDAPILRGKPDPAAAARQAVAAKWIWSRADSQDAAAGETVAVRKRVSLKEVPAQAAAVATCDNEYVLYVNGERVHAGENWQAPDVIPLTSRLKAGENTLLIVAKNAGNAPNPAGLIFEARLTHADNSTTSVATDDSWEWTAKLPNAKGRYAKEPDDWKPAALVATPQVWDSQLGGTLADLFARAAGAPNLMVRASLVKSDFLMRSLGRPNRDQIVTVRPNELTTLEAIDLSNGQILAEMLERGSKNLLARGQSPGEFIQWLFQFALSRQPSPAEQQTLADALGNELTEQGVQDALWTVLMLPEFQLVR